MKKRKMLLCLVFVSILALSGTVFGVGFLTGEGWEGYANGHTHDVLSMPANGECPTNGGFVEISADVPRTGSKSLDWNYIIAGKWGYYGNYAMAMGVFHLDDSGGMQTQDWSGKTSFEFYYKGAAANLGDNLFFELHESGGVKHKYNLNSYGGVTQTDWTKVQIDISGYANLATMYGWALVVDDPHLFGMLGVDEWGPTGQLYFDDFAAIPEPATMLLLSLGCLGLLRNRK